MATAAEAADARPPHRLARAAARARDSRRASSTRSASATTGPDLRVYGALLGVGTELFTREGVHLLSGFYGPFERALRDSGAEISFAPADFRRFAPLYERQRPRVMCTVASAPDADGWCSLALHAGGSIAELNRAGEDPDRLLVVEASSGYPRTSGLPPEYPHRIHVEQADVLIESDAAPLELPAPDPSDAERAIAANAAAFIALRLDRPDRASAPSRR